jgi:hypothetical protein
LIDAEYVAARRVLLDALEALAAHRPAIVVVGAQAIYLRTGADDVGFAPYTTDVGLAVGISPYTTDGDLTIDPHALRNEPHLGQTMQAAGFEPAAGEPGVWLANTVIEGRELEVPIDLIVPEAVAPPGGRRGARLGAHGKHAARRAVGLEAALVDHSPMTVSGLEESDARALEVDVAGLAALMVAKAHKIHDRILSPRTDRVDDKDAADLYRVMQTTAPAELGARLAELRQDAIAGSVTDAAVGYMNELFGRRGADGVQMAVRALRLSIPEPEVVAVANNYVARLMEALG